MDITCLLGEVVAIDREEIRRNTIRIPQVSLRLRQAQKALDPISDRPVDLFTCALTDDQTFRNLGVVREIVFLAIQLGLFDRLKTQKHNINRIVGSKGSLHILKTLIGELAIEDLIRPLLLGQNTLFFERQESFNFDMMELNELGTWVESSHAANQENDLITLLVEQKRMQRIISLGPIETRVTSHTVDPVYENLQVSDVITIDPMLTWFSKECQL